MFSLCVACLISIRRPGFFLPESDCFDGLVIQVVKSFNLVSLVWSCELSCIRIGILTNQPNLVPNLFVQAGSI